MPLSRYQESSRAIIASGQHMGVDTDVELPNGSHESGVLDINMAELSLGQRLTALHGTKETLDAVTGLSAPSGKHRAPSHGVPIHSLSRTLIQALHSSDSRLLETCLAHSSPAVIKNTVQRIPPQLAVSLLSACVDRLSRGHRGANLKGGGGAASAQRATGLIAWVKAVLLIHSGHLMAVSSILLNVLL